MCDKARYVGSLSQHRGRVADVRPDPDTYDLELEERKLFARFEGEDDWRFFAVTDFKLLIPIMV